MYNSHLFYVYLFCFLLLINCLYYKSNTVDQMKYLRRVSLVHILLIILAASQIVNSASVEAALNFPQYCADHGYPTNTHTYIIHTYDGYNLKFF